MSKSLNFGKTSSGIVRILNKYIILFGSFDSNKLLPFQRLQDLPLPPRVHHLDVVERLTPSMNGNQEFAAPSSFEPGRAVALGRVLVLT
jgi:hypothetical protein